MTPETVCCRGGDAQTLDVAASSKPAATVRRIRSDFIHCLDLSPAQLHQLTGATLGRASGGSSRKRGVLLPITRAGLRRRVLLYEGCDSELRLEASRAGQFGELLQ